MERTGADCQSLSVEECGPTLNSGGFVSPAAAPSRTEGTELPFFETDENKGGLDSGES